MKLKFWQKQPTREEAPWQPKPWVTQTMHLAFKDICNGERPWTALGNFMNYWFGYATDRREMLVAEPIPEAPANEYCQRWAAFCAASVEHLCNKYTVPCPEWVHDPKYILPEPWYYEPELRFRERLIAESPDEFKKRNVYSGSSRSMFDNKWELVERYKDQIEQFKLLSKKEKKQYYKTGKIPAHKD
ncbi:MAG TPA: hypothetical protein VKR06_34035 [Ktedonosporobacter sp.]|nr:hypothetical protein [Ktedonosporobacter sp.]